jgi:hypothetical protein
LFCKCTFSYFPHTNFCFLFFPLGHIFPSLAHKFPFVFPHLLILIYFFSVIRLLCPFFFVVFIFCSDNTYSVLRLKRFALKT